MPDFVGIGKAVRAAMSYPGAKVQFSAQIKWVALTDTQNWSFDAGKGA
jgi:hypothetical protein